MEAELSPYYQYNFVSAEPLIALIKEEFKSYLDTGAIDDAVWSIYVDKCLRKLGKGMLEIVPFMLTLCNYEARLPDDFHSVREAWLSTEVSSSYQLPGAHYQEVTIGTTSTQLYNTTDTYCTPCGSCEAPDLIKVGYKTTRQIFSTYTKDYLLKPGNLNTLRSCTTNSPNRYSSATDTFDIIGNKFVTNFSSGNVYMLYYSKKFDDSGYQMIPDNYRIQEYIEAFIKYKICEQLCNQVTDETYNQIEKKKMDYLRQADEAFIMADIEQKKDTIYKKRERGIREINRFNKYIIK